MIEGFHNNAEKNVSIVLFSCPNAQFTGVSKTNWDIGISLILGLNLGYWLTEIGILGYQ